MKNARWSMFVVLTAFLLFSTVSIDGCGLEFDEESEEEELGIQPTSVTLDADQVTDITFEVWGGSGSYTWSISDDSLGTVVAGDSTAIYTNKKVVGKNIIAVTDGASSITATVIQE